MALDSALIVGDDGVSRCGWCGLDTEYRRYHDQEWGMPVVDNDRIFEKICLEGFQSGLSWLTILRKRPAFRVAFKNFDPNVVAKFTDRDVSRLLKNVEIIRHRGKIEATIHNAKMTLQMQHDGGSLAKFVWGYCLENQGQKQAKPPQLSRDIRSQTPESEAMSNALRKFGFKFVGATTMYAAMQSLGIVNDHYLGCPQREVCERARFKALKTMLA